MPPLAAARRDPPVQYLKGVGPRRAAALAKLGIETASDLLRHLPARYEQHTGAVAIDQLELDTLATVRGRVSRIRRGYRRVIAVIDDGSGPLELAFFNQRHDAHRLAVEAIVVATGKVRLNGDVPSMAHPRITVYPPDAAPDPDDQPRLVPVYPATAELSSTVIGQIIERVLRQPTLPVEDPIPADLLAARELPPLEPAIRDVHAPASLEAADRARQRFAYQECLLMQLALALRRRRCVVRELATPLVVTEEIDARIRARFPFPLTAAQDVVVREIAADLAQPHPMTRLIQGDVGSGKTVVALYACLAAIAHGRQAAIMAPTELLARQHFAKVEQYLAGSRVRRQLLRGKLSANERAARRAEVASGDVDLVIGTQALLEADVRYRDLALIVVDEQHKFGVLQRSNIRTKGRAPHYLVMTATPIPRTLAMTVFGDLDVSRITAHPAGRGTIRTHVVPSTRAKRLYVDLTARLRAGEQAYVVSPRVGAGEDDADDAPTISSARELYSRLAKEPWRDLRVGLLYGGLPPDEKQQVMGDFAAGRLAALVATTVVEVGVDVPNATVMVIDHAERFGLSQLHQLRGRVGRGSRDADCYLIAHTRDEKARERLRTLAETRDGFEIAEQDLKLRGPGQLFGTRQHGLPELRFPEALDDFALLERARADAHALLDEDPSLRSRKCSGLAAVLRATWGDAARFLDAP